MHCSFTALLDDFNWLGEGSSAPTNRKDEVEESASSDWTSDCSVGRALEKSSSSEFGCACPVSGVAPSLEFVMLIAISSARCVDSGEGYGGRGVVYNSSVYVLAPFTRSLFAWN